MPRRHGQKMGCCELAVVVFALFVAFQFAVLGLRVLHEVIILAGTLVKWIGIGIAGAAGIAALTAAVFGIGYGLKQAAKGLFGWMSRPATRARRQETYHEQARRWRGGIAKAVRALQKREWLTRDDARRYRESADGAARRVRSMERDLKTLCSLPASEEWVGKLDEAAQTLVSRLERTHRALTRLLAESALQTAPTAGMNIRDAAEELESLVAALDDVTDTDPVAQAVAAVQANAPHAEQQRRAAEQLNQDLVQ